MRLCSGCGGAGLINVVWKEMKIISHEVCAECGGHGSFYEKEAKIEDISDTIARFAKAKKKL